MPFQSRSCAAFQLFEDEIRMQEGRVRLLDFGSRIFVDRVHVNAIGERELRESQPMDRHAAPTPMVTLDELAIRFLLRADDEIVQESGVAQAGVTMRSIFDAKARLLRETSVVGADIAKSVRASPLGARP